MCDILEDLIKEYGYEKVENTINSILEFLKEKN